MSDAGSAAGPRALLARLAEQPPQNLAVLIIGGVALATAVAGALLGPGSGILVLAAAALLAAISALWTSLRSLSGDRPMSADEAFGLATPRAEDEQKRTVLRALRDLEFERRVGKISDQDFAALQARYREQAAELLEGQQQVDTARLERAERLLQTRLELVARKADSIDPESADDDWDDDDLDSGDDLDSDDERATVCPGCQTRNDDDAVFCKRCGAALDDAPGSEDEP